jgi:hypothetical protein
MSDGCALVRGDSCARSGEHRFVLKGRGLGSEKWWGYSDK